MVLEVSTTREERRVMSNIESLSQSQKQSVRLIYTGHSCLNVKYLRCFF
jgi:hypothetical protein